MVKSKVNLIAKYIFPLAFSGEDCVEFRLFFIHLDTLINKRSLLPKAAIKFSTWNGECWEHFPFSCFFYFITEVIVTFLPLIINFTLDRKSVVMEYDIYVASLIVD